MNTKTVREPHGTQTVGFLLPRYAPCGELHYPVYRAFRQSHISAPTLRVGEPAPALRRFCDLPYGKSSFLCPHTSCGGARAFYREFFEFQSEFLRNPCRAPGGAWNVALLSELGTLRRFIDFFLLSDACLTTHPEQLSFYCMLPEIARGRFIPLRPPAFLPRKHANHSYPMVNLYPLADALCDHISQFFLILCIQMHTIRVTCANILCRVEIFTVIHIRQCLIPAGQFL